MNAIFKNVERFRKWFKQNYKGDFDNLNWDAVLAEVELSYATKGDADFEMSRFDSKSGNPEVYYYNVIYKYDEKNFESLEEAMEYGDFETIIIF